ncbi:MAG: DUF6036 family nucleotidyltransferase [Planctomycetota bacterium]
MKKNLTRQQIERVIRAVTDEIEADWLLVGGAAVALWYQESRSTEGVDLVEPSEAPSHRLELLKTAAALDLPIEALNSAADFFVRIVQRWDEDIVLLRSGARGRLFRPSPTNFLIMKLARLSEQDLEDCRALLSSTEVAGPLDRKRVLEALAALPEAGDVSLDERRQELRRLIDFHR